MCINKEVSLATFISSWTIGIYIFNRNKDLDRMNGLFLLTFSTMQFVEFLLWFIKEKGLFNTDYNWYISLLIPLVVILQPINLYIGKNIHENNNKLVGLLDRIKTDIVKSIYPKILIIYIIVIIIYTFIYFNSTAIYNSGHLQWYGKGNKGNTNATFISMFILALFLALPYLLLKQKRVSVYLFIIAGGVLFIYSFFYTDSFGSVWCWLGNIIAFIMLFAPQIDKNIRV